MFPEPGDCCRACGDIVQDTTYVQCDKCDDWWHFSCAGLTEPKEVVDTKEWVCEACAGIGRAGRMKRTPVKPTETPTDTTKNNLTFPERGNGEKSNLTLMELDGEENQTTAMVSDGVADKFHTRSGGIYDSVSRKPNLTLVQVSDKMAILKRRQEAERKRIQLEMELKFIKEEEELLSAESGEIVPSTKPIVVLTGKEKDSKGAASVQPSDVEPTRQQYKSRNAATNELPVYSGDPAMWPIFITHYEQTTKRCGFSDWENMIRLQKALKGAALEAVQSRLLLPEMVPEVIATLRARFGQPVLLIKALIEKVRRLSAPCKEKPDTVVKFTEAVKGMIDHMSAVGHQAHLTNPILLEEMVVKLPIDEQYSWVSYAGDVDEPDLIMFGQFMGKLQHEAAKVMHMGTSSAKVLEKKKIGTKGYVNAHSGNQEFYAPKGDSNQEGKCCLLCNKRGHIISKCYLFLAMTVKDRWQKARSLSLCFGCLGKHNWRTCRDRAVCGIGGCTYRHHVLLHDKAESCGVAGEGMSEGGAVAESNHHQYVTSSSSALFRIVPITLYGPATKVLTFAFLDEGSSVTLLDEELAEQLGVDGVVEPLCMRWTGDTTRVEKGSRRVNLKVGPIGSSRQFTIKSARTVSNLNLPQQTFQLDAGMGEHLKRLPIQQYREAVPKLLIGLDNLHLAVPLRTKEGKAGEPIAVKTRLGWCIYGTQHGSVNEQVMHICECNGLDNMHEEIRKFYDIEQLGVAQFVEQHPDVQRAQKILDETTIRIGDRFESGLLWKADKVELPPSLEMATRRHMCLERRMERDSILKVQVHRQIDDLLSKGYIHKATAQELADCDEKRVWYLPIGLVINPNKPGKVRLIWDAAAKARGQSLNDHLLKGPDDLLPLPGVLFRFRLYEIATCSDVKEMFMQIKIRKEDRQAQRFLWRYDPTDELDTYVVDVVTFGSACSPATAQYVKNRNAREHATQFPRAVEGILQSTYVDDYIDSFESAEEACRIAAEVKQIFRNGGFELRNWSSNSSKVMKHLGEASSDDIKIMSSNGEAERVLGMRWNPTSDELSFCTRACTAASDLLRSEQVPTKRDVLRCVMSLYDPLGLLAMFVIHGKILIQDLWRSGTQWDEELNDIQLRDWRRWVDLFPTIAQIRIPRAYFMDASRSMYENGEWHVFVDASQNAYACSIYLRTIDKTGEWQCTLVSGKAKVAPLKPLSIPKLELQACVLGARMLQYTQKHHPFVAKRRVLWTDSTVALSWIRADPRNYKPFVAHRVAEILELTTMDEWRWVPTDHNPADEATKWKGKLNFNWDSIWFQGPNYLLQPEDQWPTQRRNYDDTTEELRRVNLHVDESDGELLPIQLERFSRLEKLQRTVGWIVRYVDNLRRTIHGKPVQRGVLRQEELIKADSILWRQTQLKCYTNEVRMLCNNDGNNDSRRLTVAKQSHIYKLSPFMDEEGVMRMRGRIGAVADVPYSAKYPVILPGTSKLGELIVERYHRVYRHANKETIVNEVRQHYQIPKLRTLMNRIARSCVYCKVRRSLPQIPPMAPLPKERVTPFIRPFSFTGLDYFGPVMVKRGRTKEKRWVALFTCLTVRAIHLEVVTSLSTESCVMAIRRFVARRGAPVEFFSDNGTNFLGASRQLRKEIEERNENLAATFTNAHTRWTFNPPGAPHMGGVWERMVRSVKAAISTVMEVKHTPDDETFETVLLDAEAMINSRPLTYIPVDPENQEALTPNHFLLGSSSGVKQRPVLPTNYRSGLRSNWKLAQHILDGIWGRWIKEYLPVITRQGKWFENVREIRVGDLVLVIDGSIRNLWKRGVVERTVEGADGHVRQAWVRTTTGTLRRPVARLALLDIV